jgi:bifunctional UDP-N-acetylglucosamine pyrophosphorylase / glucosamine-1-phosphate N-acetyltransferase
MRTATIILTQDAEARMASALSLAMHSLLGRLLVVHVIETARSISGDVTVLASDDDVSALANVTDVTIKGPGLSAQHVIPARSDLALVIHANAPLVTGVSLQRLIEEQRSNINPITVLGPPPSSAANVQHAQACAYCFDADWFRAHADPLLHEGDARELMRIATDEGAPTTTLVSDDPDERLRIRTRVDLARAEAALRRRINEQWMLSGVTMIDPATTYVEPGVIIGRDTVIYPNTHLRGATRVGADCAIGPNTIIKDCQIGDRCRVLASVLERAVMEDEADVGPFSHLRKGARLCRGAHMGNFGEVKNATLGPGAKMGHFSYLGDVEVGKGVNIGAGTITCNYDGARKHPTVIEAQAFIGSGSMLVAPVRIGERAKTGAGSVVTHDVPADSVAYGVPARIKSRQSKNRR